MSVENILLDLDGTIADSGSVVIDIINDLAQKHYFRGITQEDIPILQKGRVIDFYKHLSIPILSLPKILSEGYSMLKERYDDVKLFDGMGDFISDASDRYKVDLLTTNKVDIAKRFLERYNLSKNIGKIQSCARIQGFISKSIPLKNYCLETEISPELVDYIGDEVRDYEAASRVGTGITLVSWGYNHQDTLANLDSENLVKNVSELKDKYL